MVNDPTPTHPTNPRSTTDHDRTFGLVEEGAVSGTGLPENPVVLGDRFRIEALIDHGGMGIIYRAVDLRFGRDVAVKVLHPGLAGSSSYSQRFQIEACITGQLQHPGIPPVYDLGNLIDGRPFLAMKLIQGQTFEAILKGRPALEHDRGSHLAVIESLCQSVAFAHSRGIIHRDLKPSNVMVGAFGEVQVMDWGLAMKMKPLAEGALGGRREVVGTPAFMSPEQAAGVVDRLTARADVFSLGAILAVLLTGKPAYVGVTSAATFALAERAELEECLARLDASSGEPELVALAKRCLSADPQARPADAGAVSDAISKFRAETEDRARRAEVERAAAIVKAREERKRRVVQLALAATLMALVALAGAAAWRLEVASAERRQQLARRRDHARVALEQAAALRRRFLWSSADGVLAQAQRQLDDDPANDLRQRLADMRRDTQLLAELDRIRLEKSILVNGAFDPRAANPRYRAAFERFGIALNDADEDTLVEAVRSSEIGDELIAALDDWERHETDSRLAFRLRLIADRVAGHSWRQDLAVVWHDRNRLEELARQLPCDWRAVALFGKVARRLEDLEGNGIALLERACLEHPGDFWLQFDLGRIYESARRERYDLAAAAYRAALAFRPESAIVHNNLGAALYLCDDFNGAVTQYQRAIELDATFAWPHHNLGIIHAARGQLREATAAYREALKRLPGDPRIESDLRACERWLALEPRLSELRAGAPFPKEPRTAVELAILAAQPVRKEYNLAYRLFRFAFASDAKLTSDHRYDAACSAVRIAAGHDATVQPQPEESWYLLTQAGRWLRDEFEALQEEFKQPARRSQVRATLKHWLVDRDLNDVRAARNLRAMPADLARDYQTLWDELDRLLRP
jgi:tetratricopeptide (TPR) repeat protein